MNKEYKSERQRIRTKSSKALVYLLQLSFIFPSSGETLVLGNIHFKYHLCCTAVLLSDDALRKKKTKNLKDIGIFELLENKKHTAIINK